MVRMNSRIRDIAFLNPHAARSGRRAGLKVFYGSSWSEAVGLAKEAVIAKAAIADEPALYPSMQPLVSDRGKSDPELIRISNTLYSLELLKGTGNAGRRYADMAARMLQKSMSSSEDVQLLLDDRNALDTLSEVINSARVDVEFFARFVALEQAGNFKVDSLKYSKDWLKRRINARIDAWSSGYVVVGGVNDTLYVATRLTGRTDGSVKHELADVAREE